MIARAFSYFLHLANIAEDFAQKEQARALALRDNVSARGTLAHTLTLLRSRGVSRNRMQASSSIKAEGDSATTTRPSEEPIVNSRVRPFSAT